MNSKGLELINRIKNMNQNENIQELIFGLRNCPPKDLKIILNEDFKRLEHLLLSVIQYYYDNNVIYKNITTQGRTIVFLRKYLKDVKVYLEKNDIKLDPSMLINLFYYENLKEIYRPHINEDWLITIIRTSQSEEEKIEITKLLLSHIQNIISDVFGINFNECIPFKTIQNLKNF